MASTVRGSASDALDKMLLEAWGHLPNDLTSNAKSITCMILLGGKPRTGLVSYEGRCMGLSSQVVVSRRKQQAADEDGSDGSSPRSSTFEQAQEPDIPVQSSASVLPTEQSASFSSASGFSQVADSIILVDLFAISA